MLMDTTGITVHALGRINCWLIGLPSSEDGHKWKYFLIKKSKGLACPVSLVGGSFEFLARRCVCGRIEATIEPNEDFFTHLDIFHEVAVAIKDYLWHKSFKPDPFEKVRPK